MIAPHKPAEKASLTLQTTFNEPPFQAVTAIVAFPGETMAEVLQAEDATLVGYDPHKRDVVQLRDM